MNIEQENIELTAKRPVRWSLENVNREEVITTAHQIYDESLHARQSEINEAA